jgi:hypothetical protein
MKNQKQQKNIISLGIIKYFSQNTEIIIFTPHIERLDNI